MKETLLVISSPLGPSTELSKFSWKGTNPRECVSIVSGIHGNQLNGIYLCSRLIRFLDAVAEGAEPDYQLKGKIQVIPAVNLNALRAGTRLWSFDDLDMDLAFPGNAQGELSEQVANAVTQHTADSHYGIVLHNAADHYEDAPHLICLNPDNVTKDMARSLGPEIAREPEESPAFRLRLYYQWVEQGMTALILSAGKPNHLNRPLCETLFAGLVNSLLWTETLSRNGKKPKKYPLRFHGRGGERCVLAGAAGLFLPLVKPGDVLKKGQKMGEVVDMYTGAVLDSPVAPADGDLVTLRDHPVVYQNEPLAVVLAKSKFRFWPFK
ncbi:hypothetical protein UR09_00160 [Candidatus Nitromaritima sp. SCGC AAA799-A02]|nr:hypothetical protein UR09_00160 [Candidatus Nitromaritima sp. SCGC AAA799-A02]